jgi:hypothetical protein
MDEVSVSCMYATLVSALQHLSEQPFFGVAFKKVMRLGTKIFPKITYYQI